MPDISEILQMCVDMGGSDIHLLVGGPPTIRLHGLLHRVSDVLLTADDTEQLMKSIASPEHQQKLQEQGGMDFGFAFGDVARFRVSIFKQKGTVGVALRMIPNKLLTFEQIGLPPGIKDILYKPRGLILVTGPTGSGKTTTLATMLDHINIERDCHIITIEDPIEYYHTHKKGIVTQRELGVDVPSFREGLVRALRMDPDVILVGEMRDLATIEAAVLAAETGHLVMATLHTVSAAQTVDRIIDVFPTHQQDQIRTQLSTSILAVLCQQLLPKIDGKGRVAVFEIMITTPSIQALIRDKKTYRITSDIQTGARHGMQTLDAHLFDLYAKGTISYGEAMVKCFDPEQMQTKIQGIPQKRK
jgi:twitching motility protein PilT